MKSYKQLKQMIERGHVNPCGEFARILITDLGRLIADSSDTNLYSTYVKNQKTTWLKHIVEKHNNMQFYYTTVFEGFVFEKCDFSDSTFDLLEFRNCTFNECDFSETTLKKGKFKECVLQGCNLDKINWLGSFDLIRSRFNSSYKEHEDLSCYDMIVNASTIECSYIDKNKIQDVLVFPQLTDVFVTPRESGGCVDAYLYDNSPNYIGLTKRIYNFLKEREAKGKVVSLKRLAAALFDIVELKDINITKTNNGKLCKLLKSWGYEMEYLRRAEGYCLYVLNINL